MIVYWILQAEGGNQYPLEENEFFLVVHKIDGKHSIDLGDQILFFMIAVFLTGTSVSKRTESGLCMYVTRFLCISLEIGALANPNSPFLRTLKLM